MSLRLLSVIAAVLLLAACESTPENTGMAGSGGGGSGSGMSTTQQGPRPGTNEDHVANVGDRVFFDTDRSTIRPDGRATLDKQSTWLKKYPSTTITIEGHADERGTREYNLALGNRRATAVKNYLVATGINPNRITTISYGKERPAVVGSNEQAWAQNRRAVTVVTSSQAGS
jgi:peptidoglycan-associated lipoprotein